MLNVVFTGPAFDNAGQSVVRESLIAACQKKGTINVLPRVTSGTSLLVASRKDTSKARNAADRGIPVMTYPEFITRYLGDVTIEKGAKPNKYSDFVEKDMLVPDFTKGLNPEDIL